MSYNPNRRGPYGPETMALLRELRLIRQGLTGVDPTNIMLQGGLHHDQTTIDKASTFTDTSVDTQGFNLVQISSDGDLTDITYKIQDLTGKTSTNSINAALSPHVIGKTTGISVTNAEAESGRTVYIDKYLAPPLLLSAIQHGTSQSVSVHASARAFYAQKVEFTSSADNFFESDQPLGTLPSWNMLGTPTETHIMINTVKHQLTPTNAVTYQLYLLQDSQATDEKSESDVFYDSGAGKTSGTMYIVTPGGSPSKMPVQVKLETAGKIYYLVDWSAAPGDTTGYIKVYGEVML